MNEMLEEADKGLVTSDTSPETSDIPFDKGTMVLAATVLGFSMFLTGIVGDELGKRKERERLALPAVKVVESKMDGCKRDLERLFSVAEDTCERVKKNHGAVDSQEFRNTQAGLDDLSKLIDSISRQNYANGETTFRNQDQMEVTVELHDSSN